MLEKFKAGVAANVDDEDFDSHYDLGVAYREMGLIDEAIFEFQKALRGATQRIRAYEALGQCFIDRSEFDVAITVLGRALREPGMEDEISSEFSISSALPRRAAGSRATLLPIISACSRSTSISGTSASASSR